MREPTLSVAFVIWHLSFFNIQHLSFIIYSLKKANLARSAIGYELL
jgi:hypothetical protein